MEFEEFEKAVSGLAPLQRAAISRAFSERDRALRDVDCGQDGPVCAVKASGCRRHVLERNGELVRERDDARTERAQYVNRLLTERNDLANKLQVVERERDEARAEVERLKAEVAAVIADLHDAHQQAPAGEVRVDVCERVEDRLRAIISEAS